MSIHGGRFAQSLALILLLIGCSDPASVVSNSPDPSPRPAPPGAGEAAAGRLAFARDCAGCHTSGDGFDLAFFGFDDATIMRRAAPHVDAATAGDIVAHVRTLEVSPVGRDARPFQPDRRVLPTDEAFAVALFGSDTWPLELTTAELRDVDALRVAAAVPFPAWSDELQNLDWMPDAPPPAGVLDFAVRGLTPRDALARYDDDRTLQSLVAAVSTLRAAERAPDNRAAPCVTEPIERFDARACFDVRRWTSTLVANRMLRDGVSVPLDPALHDVWWDVGNAARRSGSAAALENRESNWAAWMYLGWIFEPGRHASVYLGNALSRLGLPRHATFVALKAQVSRPAGSFQPYADVLTAARFAPSEWTFPAVRFGYRHLLERLQSGDFPPMERRVDARRRVEESFLAAEPALTAAQRQELVRLKDGVLRALP